jgi:hypothetical protein
MTTIAISSPDMLFEAAAYHVIDAKPAGKATFKPFRMGISKLYFDAHPVSPQWAQDWVISTVLEKIRIKGIAARNANQGSFEIPDRLPELLESLATSGRMTKVEIEAWTKENSGLFSSFLTLVRKHAADDKLAAKTQALTDLINKGAAPTPPWSEKEQALLAGLFDYLASLSVEQAEKDGRIDGPMFDSENDTLFTKLLAKLDSLQTKQASLADSL